MTPEGIPASRTVVLSVSGILPPTSTERSSRIVTAAPPDDSAEAGATAFQSASASRTRKRSSRQRSRDAASPGWGPSRRSLSRRASAVRRASSRAWDSVGTSMPSSRRPMMVSFTSAKKAPIA